MKCVRVAFCLFFAERNEAANLVGAQYLMHFEHVSKVNSSFRFLFFVIPFDAFLLDSYIYMHVGIPKIMRLILVEGVYSIIQTFVRRWNEMVMNVQHFFRHKGYSKFDEFLFFVLFF